MLRGSERNHKVIIYWTPVIAEEFNINGCSVFLLDGALVQDLVVERHVDVGLLSDRERIGKLTTISTQDTTYIIYT